MEAETQTILHKKRTELFFTIDYFQRGMNEGRQESKGKIERIKLKEVPREKGPFAPFSPLASWFLCYLM